MSFRPTASDISSSVSPVTMVLSMSATSTALRRPVSGCAATSSGRSRTARRAASPALAGVIPR
ncbi:MAG: hypothetical protein U5L06_12050 [Rhodovibrio sp.]|nr:hypothetical protein [Rhodovibrio sp.]